MDGKTLRSLLNEMRHLYLEDVRPWVVGFSGGKDSTAVLQLVYTMLQSLSLEERRKHIYVVSSDTQVETPVVIDLLATTLVELNESAARDRLPLEAHQVSPDRDQTFWINLLGKGYPAPTKSFRWCTERMKINPVNAFVLEKVAEFGEVVIILGARRAESSTRSQVIARHRIGDSRLGKHSTLSNAYVYTPIEDWTADEVWEYLMSAPRPWGGDNRTLLELYKGSNAGECPIVIDSSTPSCGNSRFGCWTCTVVTADKAMQSLVEHGQSWMRPLLEYRNMLAETTQPEHKSKFRNFRRRSGKITFARGESKENENTEQRKHVPGPYWMHYRREWLERLLTIQRDLQKQNRDIELISVDELHRIRREWLNDPIEPDWEDHLPSIYRRVFDNELDWIESDAGTFSRQDSQLLEQLGDHHGIPSALVRKLLDLEVSMDGLSKRRGMSDRIHSILSQDWAPLKVLIEQHDHSRDGGYQEEIVSLQSELDALKEASPE